MAPIKLGIIGLSANAKAKWASGAHLPYLVSARGKEKYEIVAVLNSSIETSRAAIEKFGLSPSTKAYGSPEELAADPDVQLVVDVTRVDVHYPTILPSVKAGKAAFVEWPLADNIERVRELAALARETKARTAVGVQGRLAPVYLKIQEVLASGRIGKVLSSEINSFSNRAHLFPGIEYFAQRKVGGNAYTIGLGHILDPVQFILGEAQDVQARLQLQKPELKIVDPATGSVVGTAKTDVPDLVVVTATLPASSIVKEGATFLVRYRHSKPFKDQPAHVWTIYGEKGELCLVSPAGGGLQANAVYTAPVTIEIYDVEKDEVAPVEWSWLDYQEDLPFGARSIAAVYEAYAEGDESKYATFDDALKRHEQLESWISKFE